MQENFPLKRRTRIELDENTTKLQKGSEVNALGVITVANAVAHQKTVAENKRVEEETTKQQNTERLEKSPVELVGKCVQYQFGNYTNYYNYRYEKRWEDPRLEAIDNHEYFLNKEVLDIGCNDGSVALQIAIKYFPFKILGLDIDYRLINKAVENMRLLEKSQRHCKSNEEEEEEVPENEEGNVAGDVKTVTTKQLAEKLKRMPENLLKIGAIKSLLDKSYIDENKEVLFQQDEEALEEENSSEEDIELQEEQQIKRRFPNNIYFRTENYVSDLELREKYDTIICLSTVKWVHLNFGDEGVIRLFQKVHRSLRDNGHFIFEPQEWNSYKKKKNLCKSFKDNLAAIKLRPSDFSKYLTNVLKFELVREIKPDESQVSFKRPIFIYKKRSSSSDL